LDHIKTEPTPPSERTELPIPPDLETLILRCLAKDPVERPQTALAVAAALAACGLEAPWTNERAVRWWRRHAPEVLVSRRAEIQTVAVRPQPSNDEG
jgi:serine/threonine-protein kinase